MLINERSQPAKATNYVIPANHTADRTHRASVTAHHVICQYSGKGKTGDNKKIRGCQGLYQRKGDSVEPRGLSGDCENSLKAPIRVGSGHHTFVRIQA